MGLIGVYLHPTEWQNEEILNVVQSGTTLGQKEYYLDTDSATTAIREAYKKHIVRMFQMFGFNAKAAQKKMENVMRLETELAKVSKSNTELRDPEANYNKMALSEFMAKYPHINIDKVLVASGVDLNLVKDLAVVNHLWSTAHWRLLCEASSIAPIPSRCHMAKL